MSIRIYHPSDAKPLASLAKFKYTKWTAMCYDAEFFLLTNPVNACNIARDDISVSPVLGPIGFVLSCTMAKVDFHSIVRPVDGGYRGEYAIAAEHMKGVNARLTSPITVFAGVRDGRALSRTEVDALV